MGRETDHVTSADQGSKTYNVQRGLPSSLHTRTGETLSAHVYILYYIIKCEMRTVCILSNRHYLHEYIFY